VSLLRCRYGPESRKGWERICAVILYWLGSDNYAASVTQWECSGFMVAPCRSYPALYGDKSGLRENIFLRCQSFGSDES